MNSLNQIVNLDLHPINKSNKYIKLCNNKLTNNLEFSISALNLTNDLHKELIGGAVMGSQVILRMTSTF